MEGTVNGAQTQATFYSNYTGVYDLAGVPLDVHESVFIINGNTSYSYSGTYLGNIYAIEGDARDCYLADGVTPTPIPTNATIGYGSDVVPLVCTDGAHVEVSLKLQSGGGNNTHVIATTKLYTNGGVIVSTSSSILDPNMVLLSYEINIGNNVSLTATSISQY